MESKELYRGRNQNSYHKEFDIKLKRNLLNEVTGNLQRMIDTGYMSSRVFYINMNENYIKEFLKQLNSHPLYGQFSWVESLKRNRFIFDMDNLEIKLNINKFIPNKKLIIVNERYFTETYHMYEDDLFIENQQWERGEIRDFISWCIANGEMLQFKNRSRENKPIHYTSHKNFYKVIFDKNGVTDRSIEMCGMVAKNKIHKFIDNYVYQAN